MNELINESNFLLLAAKYYDNPSCYDIDEFNDDLRRFKYIKRLFGKYEETGELRERLILNHIIILYNVFGPMATKLLFYKLKDYHHYLKPFVVMLGYMPEKLVGLDEVDVILYNSDIPMDKTIVHTLRNI